MRVLHRGISADRYRGRLTGFVWNLLDTKLEGFDVDTFEGDVLETATAIANDTENEVISGIRSMIKKQATHNNHNSIDKELGKAEGIYVGISYVHPSILTGDYEIDFNKEKGDESK